jgi:hypothetical protein
MIFHIQSEFSVRSTGDFNTHNANILKWSPSRCNDVQALVFGGLEANVLVKRACHHDAPHSIG